MNSRRYRFPVLAVLLGLTALLLLLERAHQVRAQQERPYGHYTAAQILDRAAPLCRAVAPEAGDLDLSVRRDLPDQANQHLWDVVARGRGGRDILNLCWNADTGEAYIVSHWFVPGPRSSLPPPLSRREAIAAAWNWLRALGIAERAPHWHLAGAPQKGDRVWSICWQADSRTAAIKVDDDTGALVKAQSWRTHPIPQDVRR